MNTKELAARTYQDLQKRKAEKERQRESELLSYYKYRKEKSRDVKTWYGKRIH